MDWLIVLDEWLMM
jgi:cytochrome P450